MMEQLTEIKWPIELFFRRKANRGICTFGLNYLELKTWVDHHQNLWDGQPCYRDPWIIYIENRFHELFGYDIKVICWPQHGSSIPINICRNIFWADLSRRYSAVYSKITLGFKDPEKAILFKLRWI